MEDGLEKANGLAAAGRHAQAVAGYERSLARNPGQPQAWYNLGNSLALLGRRAEALEALERSLTLDPTQAGAWNNRANLLADLRRPQEAIVSFNESLRLRPGDPSTLNNRAHALAQAKRPLEAIAAYGEAYAADPKFPFLDGAWLNARLKLCDWAGVDAHLARVAAAIGRGERAATPFLALGFTDDPALQAQAARTWAATLGPPGPPVPEPPPSDRIRLGYVSGDYHNHAIAWLIAEHVELIDRSRFELTAFSYGPASDDGMRRRLSAGFEHFVDVREMPDAAIAALARERGIDIAVELTGFTQNARPGIMLARAAPIQVNYLSMPCTMGLGVMDYMLADGVVIPPGEEPHFDEKIVRLPGTYQVSDRRREISDRAFTRADLGLPETGVVYCCFNNNYKFRPERFAVWVAILRGVPGSVLWLFQNDPASTANLRQAAASHGVDPARLVFAPPMPFPEHLARQRLADLFLDTAPYNAHTTANDALWMGLPVLTLPGGSFGSRVAASLLTACGLPELIMPDIETYEATAIALGRDAQRLAALKARVLASRTARGFDTGRFTRTVETAYETMIARRKAGLAPDHMTLDD
ncbi:putative O-linked N-acetylglucosamine transferase (SPINDLY family) [Caulobacter ginsengisoli]|uniref:protein O-GlcNAc transferase n=1 Tax=Caulobacter ginsengisoli TaxID=400775 RepID=A0ABU0IW18_9CAUL|nr:tetratricopeptide repeat protein [Caulobacter ginsengisoli]MDQ0465343.1 putative O-linked N-acetylglucosamine transferase (SPINDLY family) [Caulobacter ginsengisoli]